MKLSSLIVAGFAGSMMLGFAILTILFFFTDEYGILPRHPAHYLVGAAFLLLVFSWVIQGAIIGPAIRGFDQPRFSDWFNGPHQSDRIDEYRRLCREHGHPLFWANAQRWLTVGFWCLFGLAVVALSIWHAR